LLSSSLTAFAAIFASSADSQIAQCIYDLPKEQANQVDDGMYCAPTQDMIITIGQRIGATFVDQLTSAATIITQDDITSRGNAYIADLIRTVPGASVNRSGPSGSLTQIRLRGSEANHVLVLVDGIEVSNPNTGEFDFSSLRAEDVVKIEILRGEQSALWGADAIGGVISITTRAQSVDPHYKISLEGGSYNTLEGQVSATVPLNVFDGAALSVNGNVFSTDGYDVSGTQGEDDGAQSQSLNVGLNNVNLGALSLNGKFSTTHALSEFDADTDFNGRLDDTSAVLTTDTTNARLAARFKFLGFQHLLSASTNKTTQDTTGTSFRNDTKGTRTQFNWAAETTWQAHSLTLLAESEKESFANFGGIGAGQNQNRSITNEALAADYRFNQNGISLSASARQDFNSRFDDAFTWRVGAGYDIAPLKGRVHASYGTGVKNPSMTELFGFFPAFFVGNPNIKPETSKGFDIGYSQEIGTLTLAVDYFRSDLEDEIFTDFGVFPSTVRNRATKSKREGVELEAKWEPTTSFNMHASASFLDTTENGIKELRRPDFLASATLNYEILPDTLDLSLSLDHTGSQIDTDFATFSRVTLDAYSLVGLNARWHMNDIVTFNVRGENLLDENYVEVVGFKAQGRAVYAGISATF
ncbi:MAG TPA: TonB-dependent receptor, partial [Hellea balneolensis]|nr:TonB-dependent receptor [Hellea balneolensis]